MVQEEQGEGGGNGCNAAAEAAAGDHAEFELSGAGWP